MKANELRIGNYVKFIDSTKTIACINSNSIAWYNDPDKIYFFGKLRCCVPVNSISPIPLTEEWLVKFGFTDHVLAHRVSKPYYKDEWIYNFTIDQNMYSGKYYYEEHPILWVHQLQNLYHALTGEELTLKEYETIR